MSKVVPQVNAGMMYAQRSRSCPCAILDRRQQMKWGTDNPHEISSKQ